MIFGKRGKLPYPLDVTCNHGKLSDLIPTFNFIVILNEFVFGFSEVNGIDKDMPYDSLEEGGNSYPVFARKQNREFESIILKKGLLIKKSGLFSGVARTALSQAAKSSNNLIRKAALISAAASDPITTLENGPAYGFLQIFDRQYKTSLVSFSFFSHGASRWEISDLNASSGDFIYETITLVCSDLRRMANSIIPSGIWDTFNQNEHKYYILNDKDSKLNTVDVNNNKEPLTNKSKTDQSIDLEKQNNKDINLDRKDRLKKFEEWQNSVKVKREKEIKELNEKLEENNKVLANKLIEEIKKLDPDFDGKSMSRSDLFTKWQELVKSKRRKEIEDFSEQVKKNEEQFTNKLIEEIRKLDPNFKGNDMSRADLLAKWQELVKSKRNKEIEKFNEQVKKNEKQFANKLIEEIKKIDPNFKGNDMSRAKLLAKWQELVKSKRTKEQKNLKDEFNKIEKEKQKNLEKTSKNKNKSTNEKSDKNK